MTITDRTIMAPYPLGPVCPRHGFIRMRKRGPRWTCLEGDYDIEYPPETLKRWKNIHSQKALEEAFNQGIEVIIKKL